MSFKDVFHKEILKSRRAKRTLAYFLVTLVMLKDVQSQKWGQE